MDQVRLPAKAKGRKAMMDPYRVLGVSPNASEEEIKKAYFGL